MSTLGDAVTARYNNDELISLTRSGTNTSLTTINTTRLELAVDDVTGAFLTPHGITFDATDAQHLEVACDGVILRLKCFGKAMDRQVRDDWRRWRKEDIERLAQYVQRRRIQPKTSSSNISDVPERLDYTRFDDMVPDKPPLRSETT